LHLDSHGALAEFELLIWGGGRKQVHHARDHSGPASLMTRPQPGAVFAMEIFVELQVMGRTVYAPVESTTIVSENLVIFAISKSSKNTATSGPSFYGFINITQPKTITSSEPNVRDYSLLHPVAQGAPADSQVLRRCLLSKPPLGHFCAVFCRL